MSGPTLARATCAACRIELVTPEQVQRWPHLARYPIGVLRHGLCQECQDDRGWRTRERLAARAARLRAWDQEVGYRPDVLRAECERLAWAGVALEQAAPRLGLTASGLRYILGDRLPRPWAVPSSSTTLR